MKKETPKLHVVVAPRKKQVKIMLGKKVLKTYKFKQDVPSVVVEKEFHGYDYGAWSVSDRDFTYTRKVTEWDEETIKDIKSKALSHYQSQINQP
jgi:hypothetical protein